MSTATTPDLHQILKAPRRRTRWPWLLGVSIALAWSVALTWHYAGRPTTSWDTEPASRGDLSVTVSATGTLEATDTVEVGAEASGRVAEMLVDANDAVSAGQVLARIDPEQLQATVDQAEAQTRGARASLAEARASEAEARAASDRADAQAARGLVSAQDLEARHATATRAAAQVRSAEANAVVAEANLASARSKLGKAVIVSPIDGVVLDRKVSAGQTVTAGFTTPVLFDIAANLGTMLLVVDIDEADIGHVHTGQFAMFTVDAFGERPFPSTVGRVSLAPTTTQGVVTYEAELVVDNADLALRPGMTASAEITVEQVHSVVQVPATALRFDPDGQEPLPVPHVWILDDGTPRQVPVTPGLSDGTNTQVAGLPPESAVIVGTTESDARWATP